MTTKQIPRNTKPSTKRRGAFQYSSWRATRASFDSIATMSLSRRPCALDTRAHPLRQSTKPRGGSLVGADCPAQDQAKKSPAGASAGLGVRAGDRTQQL